MPRSRSGVLMVGLLAGASSPVRMPVPAIAQHESSERKMAEQELAGGGPHAAGEDIINPLEPQPSLAIWTLVVFVGVLLVLGRYAWKPLLAALHNREKHLEHVLLEAERARNESEANSGRAPQADGQGRPTRCGRSSTRPARRPSRPLTGS